MPTNNAESNLDLFFEMIDLVEADIVEMLEGESNEVGGYECMVICFNCLRLYCGQVGIDFSQIESQHNAFKESKAEDTFWEFDIGSGSQKGNEVEGFTRVLEKIEDSLAAFEKRCERTEESFDEWNCVLIMYSCLVKYCKETKTNYAELMGDVSKIQSDLEKKQG